METGCVVIGPDRQPTQWFLALIGNGV